jgi:hypothetical protein
MYSVNKHILSISIGIFSSVGFCALEISCSPWPQVIYLRMKLERSDMATWTTLPCFVYVVPYWGLKVLYHLSYFTSPFHVGYFLRESLLYAWAVLDHDLPVCAFPCSWDDRCLPTPSHWLRGVLQTFCQG